MGVACAALIAAGASQHAVAQNYPAKPTLIIAQATGARRVPCAPNAEKLKERWDNRSWSMRAPARAHVGTDVGAEAKRLPRVTASSWRTFDAWSNPAWTQAPYDAVKDFAPIIFVAATPYC